MAKAVAQVVRFKRAVEEEDAGWKRILEVVPRRITDALAVRSKAAEGDAEGVAQVIGGRLGVVRGYVDGRGESVGRSTAISAHS